jgi:hypothetical protein
VLIGVQKMNHERLGQRCDAVGMIALRNACEPSRRMNAALRTKAYKASAELSAVRRRHDRHRIIGPPDRALDHP